MKLCKVLSFFLMFHLVGCSGEESHFLDCGPGESIEDDSATYCAYSAALLSELGASFSCPEGTESELDFDGAKVCSSREDLNGPLQLPAEVCEALGKTGCADSATQSGTRTLKLRAAPGQGWEDDPTEYDAIVMWTRTAPNPDTTYKYGEGRFVQGELTVDIPVALPTMATQEGIYGIGHIIILSAGEKFPDGEVEAAIDDEDDLKGRFRGATRRQVLVWRSPADSYSEEAIAWREENPEQWDALWINDFEDGYDVGRCVPADELEQNKNNEGSNFDGFAPKSDDEIEILKEPFEVEGCNWT